MNEFWVKLKIVFDRGRGWVGYLTFLMMVFVTITSMKQYTYFEFLAGRYWMILVLCAGLALIFLLGYLEVRTLSLYQKEAEIYSRINPVQQKVFQNQKRILEKLAELEKKLGGK